MREAIASGKPFNHLRTASLGAGKSHAASIITIAGMPQPNPTDKAMISAVSSPELESEPELALVLALVLVRFPLLPPLLLVPFSEIFVSVVTGPAAGVEPAAVVELARKSEVLVSVGTEPATVVELALPLSPADPVATAASADTTAVVVLLGCGLFAAG